MNSNESKVQEILKQRGIDTAAVDDATEADIPEPCDRFKQLMEVYYTLKVSADMETPYWYNRIWWEEGKVNLNVNPNIENEKAGKTVRNQKAEEKPVVLAADSSEKTEMAEEK